jgi:hypothetical protein
MKILEKLTCVFCIAALVFAIAAALTGCGGGDESECDQSPIIASTNPLIVVPQTCLRTIDVPACNVSGACT